MNPFIIIYIMIYLGLLISYFFSETSGNLKRRATNKIIMASMFLLFGFIAFAINFSFFSYDILMIIGIIFAFLGDVYLLYSFPKGGILFIVSNISFFLYELILIIDKQVPFSHIWYAIPIYLLIILTFIILAKKKIIDFKNYEKAILTYISSVSLHGTLGITLAIYFGTTRMILLGIGLFLFMISDYFLMTYKFKFPHKKWILRCNSASYFIGLLLVVLSLMY